MKKILNYPKKNFIIFAVFFLIILFIWVLVGMNSEKRNLKSSPIQELTVYTYLSKSSRDLDKKEQYVFKVGDPIQAMVEFKNVYESTDIVLEVIDNKNNTLQNTPFKIEGSKSNFVTINSASEEGNYKIVIKYEGKNIGSKNFKVTE